MLAVSKAAGIESPCVPRIASGFGGGIGRQGETCGAVTGGVMALGLIYGRDAAEDRDAADRWKIRTVPTTYVLDAAGVPVEMNQGAADAPRLRAQVAAAS